MPFKLIRVESFKYPDFPRYFQPCAQVTGLPEVYLAIFHPADAPVWSGTHDRVFRAHMHSMGILYPDRDYNIYLFWNRDWTFNSYYINVALPVEWAGGDFCSYIDLDLDLLYVTEESHRQPDDDAVPGVYELDRDEFEEHQVANNFPQEIIDRAEAGLRAARAHITRGEFPFDGSLVYWQPDPDMLSLAELPDNGATWHQP